MTASASPLADTLARISQLAPDLIRTEPRGPLWEVTSDTPEHLHSPPDHGPLLFWVRDLAWAAGKHDCIACGRKEDGVLEVHSIDVIRLLPGLIACCQKRGWEWEISGGPTGPSAQVWPNPSRDSCWKDAPTPTEALAAALLSALERDA